ncbi:hypothetical protein M405DRAFT_938058 [Rhizopogon salebrosus TDB-379]|nr:hypothetical protein M405DRAFT_938058 [Rhizopogon salebrosus TDB-379]
MSDVKETYPSTAQAPFDNPDGDIILRSADGVNFHVFKLILSLASPGYQGMFMLPQDMTQTDASPIPIIPMAESSTTLESLLLLCYPAANPTFDSLDHMKAVIEAARKYGMGGAISRAGDLVMAQFPLADSLELYALSCIFGWKKLAQTVAMQTLKIKDLGRPSRRFAGMQDITGLDYHRLLVYHQECGAVAQAVGKSLAWLRPSSNDMQMWEHIWSTCNCKHASREIQIAAIGKLKVTSWFEEYLISSGEELVSRPCASTILESTSYGRAIVEAQECSNCQTEAIDVMDRFRTLYIGQVKKVLATVILEVDE